MSKDALQDAISTFKDQLEVIIRKQILDAVTGAVSVSNGNGTGKSNAKPPKANGNGQSAAPKAANTRTRGEKRTTEQIEETATVFLNYVTDNIGKRVEHISKAINIPTAELQLPIKRLLMSKDVKTTGERRATRYWPKGVRPSKELAEAAEAAESEGDEGDVDVDVAE